MKIVGEGKTMKKGAPPKDIDDYLKTVPERMKDVLEMLRKTIKAAAPKAEETISYQMPAFKYHGILVYFAAFKEHCSLFPGSKSILKLFESELEPFKTSAGATIHFTADNPLPAGLVKKIVKARMEENESRFKNKHKGHSK